VLPHKPVSLLLGATSIKVELALLNFLSKNNELIDDYAQLVSYLEKIVVDSSFLSQILQFDYRFFVWY
jgi:hypothetical protein